MVAVGRGYADTGDRDGESRGPDGWSCQGWERARKGRWRAAKRKRTGIDGLAVGPRRAEGSESGGG